MVKALFFDVGGTVFDWKNTARQAICRCARDAAAEVDDLAFATDWREQMFQELVQVRLGNVPWMHSDAMNRRALENISGKYPVVASLDKEAFVAAVWHNLQTFPGARAAIDRLREKYVVNVLSVLSWRALVASSKKARIQWDGILSCEFLGFYKPSLEAYRKACGLLGLKTGEAMMVAAHGGDLKAAKAAGMATAFVRVPEEDVVGAAFGDATGTTFDVTVADYEALCTALGA